MPYCPKCGGMWVGDGLCWGYGAKPHCEYYVNSHCTLEDADWKARRRAEAKERAYDEYLRSNKLHICYCGHEIPRASRKCPHCGQEWNIDW